MTPRRARAIGRPMNPIVREARLGDLDTLIVETTAAGTETTAAAHLDAVDRSLPLTVVLCHGFGAPATDLVDLAAAIRAPSGTRFVFPAAPLPVPALGPDARAWWPVDIATLGAAVAGGHVDELCATEPPGLARARDALTGALEAARARWSIGDASLVVGGFSQGAILSADVAFRSRVPLGGLLVLSGMLFAREAWRSGMRQRRGLRVVQTHGTADPILPFGGAERLRDEIAGAGLDLDWVAFPGGHGIGPGALEAVGRLLAAIARAAEPPPRGAAGPAGAAH